eukprot:CFRG5629T1
MDSSTNKLDARTSSSTHQSNSLTSCDIAAKRQTLLMEAHDDDLHALTGTHSSISIHDKSFSPGSPKNKKISNIANNANSSTTSLSPDTKRRSWMNKLSPNAKRKSAAAAEWDNVEEGQQLSLATAARTKKGEGRGQILSAMPQPCSSHPISSVFEYNVIYVGHGQVSGDKNSSCREALNAYKNKSLKDDDIRTGITAELSDTSLPIRGSTVSVCISLQGVRLNYAVGELSPSVQILYPLCHVALSLMEQNKKSKELRIGIVFWDSRIKKEYVMIFKGEHTAEFNVALRWAFHTAATQSTNTKDGELIPQVPNMTISSTVVSGDV